MSNLHPVFQPILAALLAAGPDHMLRVSAYQHELATFDWAFEVSDDAGYVRRSRETLQDMQREQKAVDVDGAVWNKFCTCPQLCIHAAPEPDWAEHYAELRDRERAGDWR